jgi:hypothetical protein
MNRVARRSRKITRRQARVGPWLVAVREYGAALVRLWIWRPGRPFLEWTCVDDEVEPLLKWIEDLGRGVVMPLPFALDNPPGCPLNRWTARALATWRSGR